MNEKTIAKVNVVNIKSKGAIAISQPYKLFQILGCNNIILATSSYNNGLHFILKLIRFEIQNGIDYQELKKEKERKRKKEK